MHFSWFLWWSGEHGPTQKHTWISMHFSWLLWWSGEHGRAQHHWKWFLRWSGERGKPRIIENAWISYMFDNLFGGVGSVESPRSLNMHGFPYIFMISSMEWEAWEGQNHWKCIGCHAFFMSSSVEWETWEAQNHWKCKDFHFFFIISSAGWEAWEARNHWTWLISMHF